MKKQLKQEIKNIKESETMTQNITTITSHDINKIEVSQWIPKEHETQLDHKYKAIKIRAFKDNDDYIELILFTQDLELTVPPMEVL